ncbi:hypothetical protein [Variovorax soli]|uniref:Helix-turn-helix domain-containing protein n=1 Tax=Variovorax soli TaxID=376815 RepID=A0ABU1NG35_9BURK|nr:hypothetical protein [Variovorax soli]MDR6536970.1 hypothetical protein [Variovorax soli]
MTLDQFHTIDAETDRIRANVETTAAVLRAAAIDQEMVVSGDGRIGEKDAAKLIGYSAGYLKALRLGGEGPVHFSMGMRGRVSYRFEHLASWIEMARNVR